MQGGNALVTGLVPSRVCLQCFPNSKGHSWIYRIIRNL